MQRGGEATSALDALVEDLSSIAQVDASDGHTIITLIADVGRSSEVATRGF